MADETTKTYRRRIFDDQGVRRPAESEARPRRRRKIGLQARFFLFSVLTLGALGTALYAIVRPAPESFILDTYQYAAVTARDFRDLIIVNGTVVPDQVLVVTAPSAARVEQIDAPLGSDVTEGEVVMLLHSDSLADSLLEAEQEWERLRIALDQARIEAAQELAKAEEALSAAQVALAEAQEALPLQEQLYELGAISARELEAARRSVDEKSAAAERAAENLSAAQQKALLTVLEAEQRERAALRQLQNLEEQRDRLTVRAPIDGRLLRIDVRQGQRVGQGDPLAEVADLRRQQIEARVSPSQAERLVAGQRVEVSASGRTFEAKIAQIDPQAVSEGQETVVPVRLSLAPEDAASLRPNAPVRLEIELGVRRGRPALPRGPFFASGDAAFVYLIAPDGERAVRQEVRYGALDGDWLEIVDGLQIGDRVIYSAYSAYRSRPAIQLVPEGGRLVGDPN